MAIELKTKQWGNSIGVIIPKEIVDSLRLKPKEIIIGEFERKDNPLKELFGFGKGKKISKNSFLENRKSLESKYI